MKVLYTENYKTLLEEIKEGTNTWNDIPCPWIGINSLAKMCKTIVQNNLQIPCNPCKNLKGIFQRNRTKIPKYVYGTTKESK